MLVDDLSKVYEILKEVRKINSSPSARDSEWTKFGDLLNKWTSLSQENKDREFTEHVCSELNLFLKLKDTAYFETTVKPYVQAKMEKTFIDFYLLEDARVLTYASLDKTATLNALEKCLLISALTKHNK
jgi:hypothetical protein